MGLETMFGTGAITSKLNKVINWGRKYSFFPFPFVTACCGMEFMATWGSHYDVARFGAEFPRFSPRQADLLMVVGTINHKIAPSTQACVRPNVRAKMGGSLRCVCLLGGILSQLCDGAGH